ncbi:hypothetical protein [Mucilaginibacter sp.]|uniref:hypothetical protein n=1 Tax=Mucilaginibacter sp. TaxID=1882438 RepID=UPI0035BBE94B
MKKTALLILCALLGVNSFSQTPQSKKDSSKAAGYQPDPNKLYNIALTSNQISTLLQSSQAGVIPLLKAIKLPMDKLDDTQAYFAALTGNISNQYRRQYVTDSLKSIQPIKK